MTDPAKLTPPGIDPLLSPRQLAAWLGCSEDTVRRMVRNEGLPYIRWNGTRKRFSQAAVQAWLDARATRVRPTAAAGEPSAPAAPAPVAMSAGDWRERQRQIGKKVRAKH
jgi:excisionase family DNA binding protein